MPFIGLFISKNKASFCFCLYKLKADDRFTFLADWYDAQASLNKRYQLFFYPSDNSVELVGTQ